MEIGILGPPAGVAEGRVLVTPRQSGALEQVGVHVRVERGAGDRAGLFDGDWEAEGATVAAREDVLANAEVVLSVARPTPADVAKMRNGAIAMGFFHAEQHPELIAAAGARGIRLVGLERVTDAQGRHPFRERMAEIAGVVSVTLAGRLMLSEPGYGVVLGGVTGVPPTQVVVIGAGALGRAATRAFSGAGAQVLVLDRDLAALDAVEREGLSRVHTILAGRADILDAATQADVLVGAVRDDSGPAPKLLSAFDGKPGAVWLDLSVDEGGCVQESRPVYRAEDAYRVESVLLCPVPNLASWAARTATRIGSALLQPALLRAADRGRLDLELEAELRAGAL